MSRVSELNLVGSFGNEVIKPASTASSTISCGNPEISTNCCNESVVSADCRAPNNGSLSVSTRRSI